MQTVETSLAMFPQTSLGMLWVFLTWILQVVLLTGIGMLAKRAISPSSPALEDLAPMFWLGFAFTIVFLELWHLWMPVDGRAAIAIGIVGAVGLLTNQHLISAAVKSVRRSDALVLVVAGLVVFWFADRGLAAPSAYDNGMCHIPVIRWNSTYPNVKGLGNLDGHFSFSNANLL